MSASVTTSKHMHHEGERFHHDQRAPHDGDGLADQDPEQPDPDNQAAAARGEGLPSHVSLQTVWVSHLTSVA